MTSKINRPCAGSSTKPANVIKASRLTGSRRFYPESYMGSIPSALLPVVRGIAWGFARKTHAFL